MSARQAKRQRFAALQRAGRRSRWQPRPYQLAFMDEMMARRASDFPHRFTVRLSTPGNRFDEIFNEPRSQYRWYSVSQDESVYEMNQPNQFDDNQPN